MNKKIKNLLINLFIVAVFIGVAVIGIGMIGIVFRFFDSSIFWWTK